MDIITLATGIIADRSVTFTATVIVAGIGIVLCTLLVLIGVFYAFGAVVSKSQANAKKKEAKKMQSDMEAALSKASESVPAPAPVPTSAPVIEEGISGEVVAAISAAVYAMEGGSAVIRSVSRKASPVSTRNPWAQAAVVDNTRPF
ncbi:OadG family protein [uncultured Eubacterium sp.]|uniref:OadG family protein n=1 Tax=uncultured Eubacterium sp. TaxID=165185 RepID=UPI002588979A|nr:OadG family protein [uncultured Eubacterium sp.]